MRPVPFRATPSRSARNRNGGTPANTERYRRCDFLRAAETHRRAKVVSLNDAPLFRGQSAKSADREFLYVEDCAEGILKATEHYDGDEPVNLGTNHEVPIKELAQIIAEETGFTGKIMWDTTKPNGQPRRCLDTKRAEELFGFKAQIGFREGLQKTIAWYREYHI